MRRAPLLCSVGVCLGVGLVACGGDDSADGNDTDSTDADSTDDAPDAPTPDAPPPDTDATVQVVSYAYRFDVVSRAAHPGVVLTVTSAGACISLDYAAGTPTNVILNGITATSAAVVDGKLRACGAAEFATGTIVELGLDTTVALATLSTSQVGYSVSTDADGNALYYMISWVGGCSRFGPCDARPGVFAHYAFDITHPATHDVRCSGTITEVSDSETRCEFTLGGGPTYSTFGFAAYPAWTQTALGTWGSAPVTLYDRASTGTAAEIDATYHGGFVDFMETTFGAYPYGDLRILTAPTYWAGFEHPGNIVLDDLLARQAGTYDVAHTLNHEIAHMWAGDQTTLADTYDFVWKESMAEYLSYVYETTANPTHASTTVRGWKSGSVGSRFYPVPAEHPQLFSYYGDVYGPGPLILFRQLEVLSSRAQVIAALQDVLGEPSTLSVDQLLAALASHTGLDLTDYTAAWIKGTGVPARPRVQTTYTTGNLHVALTAGAQCRCKFHIELRGDNGETQLVEVDTFRNGPTQDIAVTPAFTVTSTGLDPLYECLVLPAALQVSEPATRPRYLSPRAWGTLPRAPE